MWLAKENGSMWSGREFMRKERLKRMERLVSDNLGMGIWRSECVRVGLHGTLKVKLEMRSGQSMAEFRMLCISFKSDLRIKFGILDIESVGKTVSADVLRR